MSFSPERFEVAEAQAGQTLAALLRAWKPGQSWSAVRKLVSARRVSVNGEICLDDARRLKVGDVVEVAARSAKVVDHVDKIPIRYIDEHLIVVEKPSGISTVRHPAERDWMEDRRLLSPTLDDLVLRQIGQSLPRKKHDPRPRFRVVQRLDKETSGLLVFARTVEAERGLGMQFRRHTVVRRYFAVVPGTPTSGTIQTRLVRDRGDGKRGSWNNPKLGKEAVTHVEVVEHIGGEPGYSVVSCRLETGRTHQIRIHLSESGHPVCGDKVYRNAPGEPPLADVSGAPRLALHATELGFEHPVTLEKMHWDMPWPAEIRAWLETLSTQPDLPPADAPKPDRAKNDRARNDQSLDAKAAGKSQNGDRRTRRK